MRNRPQDTANRISEPHRIRSPYPAGSLPRCRASIRSLGLDEELAMMIRRSHFAPGNGQRIEGERPVKRRLVIVFAAVAAVVGSALVTVSGVVEAVAAPSSAGAGGGWGKAAAVPGLAALEAGGEAQVVSVSCASAGNCGAGGFYAGTAFVVTEIKGHWGKAIEVPGLGALNKGGDAAVA